jgi:hypothetical protein
VLKPHRPVGGVLGLGGEAGNAVVPDAVGEGFVAEPAVGDRLERPAGEMAVGAAETASFHAFGWVLVTW